MLIEELDLRALGRKPRGAKAGGSAFSCSYTRDLTREDILATAQPQGTTAPSVLALRHTHHNLARLLAQGTPGVEAAAITGYSQSRISILKADPAFQELLAHYAGLATEVFVNVHERLAGLGTDALEELSRRLDEDPESFTHKELLAVMEASMDRSGHGKTATVNVNAVSASSLLEAVKAEAQRRSLGNVTTRSPGALAGPADAAPHLGAEPRTAAVDSDEAGPGSLLGVLDLQAERAPVPEAEPDGQ